MISILFQFIWLSLLPLVIFSTKNPLNDSSLPLSSSSSTPSLPSPPLPNQQQHFWADGIDILIPAYNDSIVPINEFDINMAGRIQRIVRQYFPGTQEYIRMSIQVRDTIGRGLAKEELGKELREMLERAGETAQLSTAGLLANFDQEFGKAEKGEEKDNGTDESRAKFAASR